MTEKEEKIILNNCVYDNEFQFYQDISEEDFKKNCEEVEEALAEIDEKYCEPLFIKIISIATIEGVFSKELVFERYKDYIEAKNFLKTEEHEEIYSNFGIVIPKKNDKYSMNLEQWKKDVVKRTLIEKEGFSSESELMNDVEEIINQKWKDRTQMISSKTLNENTKKDEGINFKKFIFCEEYLKTGKVKKTCELLGIGRTTAHNYLNDEEVKKYLKERQEEIMKENEDSRKKTFDECFEKLQEIMNEHFGNTGDKIKAIDVFLKHYSNIYMRNKNEVQEQENNS